MAKRKIYLPEKYSSAGYSDWGIKRTIREAENVARWNPWLAHAWMMEARNELSLEKPFFTEFDEAVKRINAMWAKRRYYRWYNEADFWAIEGEPRAPQYLELSSQDDSYDFTI
jgi:hypothetical protein